MEDTIFTKIIKGDIPSYTLYEDDRTIAFLDIDPSLYGHTLIVTKAQVDQFIDLSDEDYSALWRTVKKVAAHLRKTLDVERVVVKIIGTDVPHTHVHLLPFSNGDKPYHTDNSPKLTNDEFTALAEKLKL